MADESGRNGDDLPTPRPMARVAPELGRLRPGASGDERAQHYASVVAAYPADRAGLICELDETKGIALQAAGSSERALKGIGRVELRLEQLFPRKRKAGHGITPIAPSEYLPEVTETGTYRVAPDAWEGIQKHLEEQNKAIAALVHERDVKAAEARGAAGAIEEVHKQSDRRQKRVATICTVLGVLGATAAWLLGHFHIL